MTSLMKQIWQRNVLYLII